MAGGFFAQTVALIRLFGNRQLLGHVVEQLGQTAELVIAEYRPGLAEVALSHRPRALCQRQHRRHKTAGKIQSHHQRQKDGQQCRDQQRGQEKGLQAFFGITQLGVFGTGRFNQRRVLGNIFRNRLTEKQCIILIFMRTDQHPALSIQHAADVFQTAYRAGLLQLLPSFFVERRLIQLQGVDAFLDFMGGRVIKRQLGKFGSRCGLGQRLPQVAVQRSGAD